MHRSLSAVFYSQMIKAVIRVRLRITVVSNTGYLRTTVMAHPKCDTVNRINLKDDSWV